MYITLQDVIVQTVTLGAPSTGVPSTGVFAVWRFFHPSLSFSWKERSVPNKYTTILRFSESVNRSADADQRASHD